MKANLKEVISAAAGEAVRQATEGSNGRRVPLLRAVETCRPLAPRVEPATTTSVEPAPDTMRRARQRVQRRHTERDRLGSAGFRLALWLGGFQDALMERQRQGEQLTETEESLVDLSRKEFASIRPLAVNITLERLHAVMNEPGLLAEAKAYGAGRSGSMEAVALDILRGLVRRARRLLRNDGPDAALSVFGGGVDVLEPLAIFQLVFSTALSLVEAFQRIATTDGKLLTRIADALDSEVERI